MIDTDEPNELERCRTCGAHTGLDRHFCRPGAMHYDAGVELDDAPSFCEKAYQSRVNAGLPLTAFRPWSEEVERQQAGKDVPSGGEGQCGLRECRQSVDPPKVYCSEAHRARAYRLRRRGEL